MVTEMDDLRRLSEPDRDPHHGILKDLPDRYFELKQITVMSERALDGSPLVAVGLQKNICPIDPEADIEILYWLANLNLPQDQLLNAFIDNIERINTYMISVGSTKVWGRVNRLQDHLTTRLLNFMVSAGACQRVDYADIDVAPYEGTPPGNLWIYVGEGQAVTDFIRTRRTR